VSGYQFGFEKLKVWQEARLLAREMYLITRTFPPDERFSLSQQIRRAATSVAANLAEGTTRTSAKDQAWFTTISFGSLMELLNHLIIASDLSYISTEQLSRVRSQIQTLSVKLSNLKRAQLSRINGFKTLWWMIFMPQLFQELQPLTT
jgi:four helix bundle protein